MKSHTKEQKIAYELQNHLGIHMGYDDVRLSFTKERDRVIVVSINAKKDILKWMNVNGFIKSGNVYVHSSMSKDAKGNFVEVETIIKLVKEGKYLHVIVTVEVD